MSTLQDKYAKVVSAAQSAGVSNLQVREQSGVLYVTGTANSSAVKDEVWNALGTIDPTFTASDINIDVQVSGLAAGVNLTVNTEETNLNVREKPSTDATVVGKAGKGELVTLVEQSSDDWWKIRTSSGVEGYAYSRYLKA